MTVPESILGNCFWLAITVVAFFACRKVYLRLGHPLLHPVLWSTLVLAAIVAVTSHPPSAYRQETAALVWLLGPAVVAMAVPVWERRGLIVSNWRMFAAVVGASITFSIASIVELEQFFDSELVRALALKSVTAPVALGIAHQSMVREDLTLVGVMLSGMFGMVAGPLVLTFFGAKGGDRPEVGIALGCASHGLGTARAFEIGPSAGAFASVCMGLSALAYGLVLPLALSAF
jgi:putative effector of murein hydrolase